MRKSPEERIAHLRTALAAAEQRLGQESAARERAEHALARATGEVRPEADLAACCLEIASVMLLALDAQGRVTLINPQGLRILGCTGEEEVLGKDWFANFLSPRLREPLTRAFQRLMRGELEGTEYDENPVLRPDGEERLVAWHNAPLRDAAGHIGGVLRSGQDVTAARRAERALAARERQQAAVAMLGQRALASAEVQPLLDIATRTVAEVLGVEYCKVLELRAGGAQFLLRAGVGWRPGSVGHALVAAGRDSQAGYTLHADAPVIVEDLRTETRFRGPALLAEHRVVSGLSCAIAGPGGRPWGVLGAHTRDRRSFGQDDVNLLVAVANILAAVIERREATRVLSEREADLRRAQALGRIGSWRLDLRSNVLTGSEETYRIFGVPQGTPMTYETFLCTVHPGDRESVDRAWQAALRGEPYDIAHRLAVGGEAKRVRERAELELAEDGTPVGAFGTVQDITERTRTEAALRESQARLSLALEAAGAGHWEWDLDSERASCDAECYRLWGVEGQRERLHDWFELVHAEDRERVDRGFREAASSAGELRLEFRVDHPQRGVRWLMARGRTLSGANGCPPRLCGLAVDITQRKEAEEALREADRRKDEFLATLAHELRNPLAPIRNAVDILALQPLSDPTLQTVRDILDRQSRQLVRLVDDLLDVNRIARGKLRLRKERVELGAVLAQALEGVGAQVRSSGLELSVALPPEPIYLEADPLRLAQVFVNLLANASKFTDRGGRIRVSAARNATEAAVTVADTGIGIAPEHLSRIFDMFAQVGSPATQPRAGIGIGLALARQLAQMHGGRIEAHSGGLGQGSAFVVRLPIPADAAAPKPPLHGGQDLKAQTDRRVLVVDDERVVAQSLATLLRLLGSEVETAHDGIEAIAAAERYRPDVIFLDIGMPKLDGYAACRRIRDRPWGKGIKIVALTGWGTEEDRRLTKEAGFDEHLVKPADRAILSRVLAEPGPAKASANAPN